MWHWYCTSRLECSGLCSSSTALQVTDMAKVGIIMPVPSWSSSVCKYIYENSLYLTHLVATHSIECGNQRCKHHGHSVYWGREDLHRTGIKLHTWSAAKDEDGKFYTFGLVTAGEIFFCTLFTRKYVGPVSPFCACSWIPNIQPVVALLNWNMSVCLYLRKRYFCCVAIRQAPLRTLYLELQIRRECGVSHSAIAFWNQLYSFFMILLITVIPRLTKIIRSGIAFVSRNVISRRFYRKSFNSFWMLPTI